MKTFVITFMLDELLEKCIRSIPVDYIVDGGAQESTKLLAQKYGIKYHGQRWYNICDELNWAFETGFKEDDIVLKLDNDTHSFTGLDHLARAIETHPDCDIFMGIQYNTSLDEGPQWQEGFFAAMAVRKSAWEKLGPLDNTVLEDWDWARRWHEVGIKTCTPLEFKYVHDAHGTHRLLADKQDEYEPVRGAKVEAYYRKWADKPKIDYKPYHEGYGPYHHFVDANGNILDKNPMR